MAHSVGVIIFFGVIVLYGVFTLIKDLIVCDCTSSNDPQSCKTCI